MAKTNFYEHTTHVFFQKFQGFRSHVYIFNAFWVIFCLWCNIVVVQCFSFACGSSIFPEPFIKETVLPSLYSLGIFVVKSLTTYPWIYLWAFYSVVLIYVFISIPMQYCFDYYNFVIQFEIRVHYISSFVFLSQDCFGYSGGLPSFQISIPRKICYFCVHDQLAKKFQKHPSIVYVNNRDKALNFTACITLSNLTVHFYPSPSSVKENYPSKAQLFKIFLPLGTHFQDRLAEQRR